MDTVMVGIYHETYVKTHRMQRVTVDNNVSISVNHL